MLTYCQVKPIYGTGLGFRPSETCLWQDPHKQSSVKWIFASKCKHFLSRKKSANLSNRYGAMDWTWQKLWTTHVTLTFDLEMVPPTSSSPHEWYIYIIYATYMTYEANLSNRHRAKIICICSIVPNTPVSWIVEHIEISKHLAKFAEKLLVEHLFYTITIATNKRTPGTFLSLRK